MGIIKPISKRDRGRNFCLIPAAARRAIPIIIIILQNLTYILEWKKDALSVV